MSHKIRSIFCLLFICLSTYYTHSASPKRTERVVVVGAGLAGLTCAYRLDQAGFDVKVLEARGRVGGRAFSGILEGKVVEIGGQNICDGGEAPCMLQVIEELGLATITYTREQVTHHWDGENFVEIAPRLAAHVEDLESLRQKLDSLQTACFSMQDVLDSMFSEDAILHTSCGTRIAAYEGPTPSRLSSNYVNTLYCQMQGALCTAHASIGDKGARISFKQVDGGNGLIAERLATLLGDKVHLNSPVSAITQNEDGSYLLTIVGGEEISADIIVMAVPCPVYANITIDPQIISTEQQATITSITYGTNGKILVPVHEKKLPFSIITTDRSVVWNDEHIHILTVAYQHDSGSFTADSVVELFAKELSLIKQLYNLSDELQDPCMSIDKQLAVYTRPIAHSWPNDKYAGGSYSCVGAGQEKVFLALEDYKGEKVKSLFAPKQDTFFFAGEHTCISPDICGTMEAAIESGERIARIICSK